MHPRPPHCHRTATTLPSPWPHYPPPRSTGATSAAISRKNAGLTRKLSGAAAFVAIGIGSVVLLSGLGVELPLLGSLLGGAAH